jgi:hypothetical protein
MTFGRFFASLSGSQVLWLGLTQEPGLEAQEN